MAEWEYQALRRRVERSPTTGAAGRVESVGGGGALHSLAGLVAGGREYDDGRGPVVEPRSWLCAAALFVHGRCVLLRPCDGEAVVNRDAGANGLGVDDL